MMNVRTSYAYTLDVKKKKKKREKQVKLIKRSCEDTQRESHMIVSNITRYNEVSN